MQYAAHYKQNSGYAISDDAGCIAISSCKDSLVVVTIAKIFNDRLLETVVRVNLVAARVLNDNSRTAVSLVFSSCAILVDAAVGNSAVSHSY